MRVLYLLACVLAACALVASNAPAQPSALRKRVLPLFVHVTQQAGRAVATPDFIAQQVERANQIFAPYGVGFSVVEQQPLAGEHAELQTRADRDALGRFVRRGRIDWFVVAVLRDVDEPDRVRRGVHWHSQTYAPAHFVIVSVIAGPDVLAHELGHYLGNPEHSQVPGNLMSYARGEGRPFLDDAQRMRMERALKGYIARGELKPIRGSP